MKTVDLMRRDWDDRARKNALFYILDSRDDWDSEAFFQSGEDDYQAFVEPVLKRIRFNPAGKVMLELGCGAGRMTQSFAARFHTVYALDISSEMLQRGQQLMPGKSNVVWQQGNGTDFAAVANESTDLVFSYLVLQHLPTEQLVSKYVSEIIRVLRPGGFFLFQFNSLPKPTMNLKGRVAWAIVDTFWSAGFVQSSRWLASAFGFDPVAAGRSWRGAPMPVNKMRTLVSKAGGTVLETNGDGTSAVWCYGTRVASALSYDLTNSNITP
jgi:SAM-dependent methyltransferase